MSDPDEKAWVRNRIEGPEKTLLLQIMAKKLF